VKKMPKINIFFITSSFSFMVISLIWS